MIIRTQLLDRIAAFLALHSDMTERAFGIAAVADPKLIKRLRDGAGVTLTSIEKAEAFMASFDAGQGAVQDGQPQGVVDGRNISHSSPDGQAA